jgi:hypothetical protein
LPRIRRLANPRRPLLAWARQMPLGGEPAGLVARIEAYDAWLAASEHGPAVRAGRIKCNEQRQGRPAGG